jgi:SPP1 gp7 family putative phage head morphogenesis protein
MGKRIEAVFDTATKTRSVTIARTEVARSANFTTFDSYKQSKVVERKQWVATLAGNTRDTHLEMNGVVLPLDQPFVVGGAPTMYPGETGVPAEDVNCRCTVVAVIGNEFSEEQLAATWKVFDRRLVPWENQTMAAVREAFGQQEADVLAVLRSVLGEAS